MVLGNSYQVSVHAEIHMTLNSHGVNDTVAYPDLPRPLNSFHKLSGQIPNNKTGVESR